MLEETVRHEIELSKGQKPTDSASMPVCISGERHTTRPSLPVLVTTWAHNSSSSLQG